MIIDPERIDFLAGRTQEIGSNRDIFDKMLKDLNRKRWWGNSQLNNLVDAEHAAVSYDANLNFWS